MIHSRLSRRAIESSKWADREMTCAHSNEAIRSVIDDDTFVVGVVVTTLELFVSRVE